MCSGCCLWDDNSALVHTFSCSVCPIRGVPGNCGSGGGDSTRYYVTLQATRVRSASVFSRMLSFTTAHILHNDITIITACYYIYAQNGLFIFSTMILYMLNLSVNYNLSVSPCRNICNCSFTSNTSYTIFWYSHSPFIYQISHSHTR